MIWRVLFIVLWMAGCTPEYKGDFAGWISELAEKDAETQAIALQDFWFDHPDMPLVEDTTVTFIFENPDHHMVGLVGDITGWTLPAIPMDQIFETDFYQCRLVLPDSASLEYQFYLKNRLIPDPKNKKSSRTASGTHSLLYMPHYQFPLAALADRKRITTEPDTVVFQTDKSFIFYAPDRLSPIHLLVFVQGDAYLQEGKAQVIIENMRPAGHAENFAALFCTGNLDQAESAALVRSAEEAVTALRMRFPSLQIKAVTLAAHSQPAWTLLEILPQLTFKPQHLILQSPQFEAGRLPMVLAQARNLKSITICYSLLSPDKKHAQLVQELKSRTITRAVTAAEGDNWPFWRKALIRSLHHIQEQDVK